MSRSDLGEIYQAHLPAAAFIVADVARAGTCRIEAESDDPGRAAALGTGSVGTAATISRLTPS